MYKLLCACLWLTCAQYGAKGQDFEVPDATVEAFFPSGLKVSIPDQKGITLFAFHGKINEEMIGREAGMFSRDITKPKDGRWTFYDSMAKLAVGDILYYWTYADYFDGERKLGYPKDDQVFEVKELLPKPGRKPTTTSTTPPSIPVVVTTPPSAECKPSVTTVRGKNSCKGKLIFHSHFENFLENRDKLWTVQTRFASEPDFEFVIYEDNPQTLSIHNGRLIIKPILTDSIYGEGFVARPGTLDLGERCTGIKSIECCQNLVGRQIIPPVMSSQLTTKGKFSFKYGRIDIRAKLPKGDWLYPELFLNSENEEYGSGYESGQIRVAFLGGNEDTNKKLQGGLILGNSLAARKYAMKSIDQYQSWTNEYHNFSVLWKPDSISLKVDNVVFGSIFPPNRGFWSLASNLNLKNSERWKQGSKMAPFDKEMNIVVGVGAGGHNFEDRSDNTKPWINSQVLSQKNFYKARNSWEATWGKEAQMEVEYVKVWALDE
ncbi:beta-1,3-glucan-binding protein-like [Euwallacea fornicatus]|uniref:beta-1,3-glucan-binding protein-like n=1 Tax=Euwallacea fornicatus TaxID=995702 RepID=UPI00338FD949